MSRIVVLLLRSGGLASVLASLTAACALLIVSGSLLFSGIGQTDEPERLAGADIVIGGSRDVVVHGAQETEKVQLPGPALPPSTSVATIDAWARAHHAQLVTDHVSPATTDSGDLAEIHSWASSRLGTGRDQLPLTGAPGQVMIEQPLADRADLTRGSSTQLRTATGLLEVEVVQILPGTGAQRPAIFLDDATAATLSGTGPAVIALTGVGGDVEGAADELRSQLGDAPVTVATGPERGLIERPHETGSRGHLTTLGGSLVALVVLVTIIAVSSTMSTTMNSRRRTLTLLRTLATTPKQLIRAHLAEGAALAAAAVVMGIPAGLVATALMDGALRLAGALSGGVRLQAGPPVIAGAAACTLALSAVLSWATIRRFALASPSAVVGSAGDTASGLGTASRLGPAALALGWALLVTGIGLSLLPLFLGGIVPVAVAGGGGLLLAFSAGILSRPVITTALRVRARQRLRAGRGSAWLSGAQLQAWAPGVAAASAPLVMAMSLALVQVAVPAGEAVATERNATRVLGGSQALTSAAGVPVGEVDGTAIARQRVSAWTEVLGAPEDLEFAAIGVQDGRALPSTAPPKSSRWDGRSPHVGATVISRFAADSLGLDVGDRANIVLGDGSQITPVVTAIHGEGQGVADIVLPFEQLAGHRGAGQIGAGAADAIVTGPSVPRTPAQLSAIEAPALVAEVDANRATALSALPLVALFAYIAISVAGTMAHSVSSRRREVEHLRRLGVLDHQLRSALWFEARSAAATCVLVGLGTALLPLAMISWGITGTPWPVIPVWFVVLDAAGVALLALTATWLPGRLLLRR